MSTVLVAMAGPPVIGIAPLLTKIMSPLRLTVMMLSWSSPTIVRRPLAGLKTAELSVAGNTLLTRKKRLDPLIGFVTDRDAPVPVSNEPRFDHATRLELDSSW